MRIFIKIFFLISLFIFSLTFAPGVHAATYYVSTSGNDANLGSLAFPYETINRARVAAIPGDTIYVRGGVYSTVANINKSGTANAPIKYLAYPGEIPVIDGNNYTLATGFGALIFLNADYVEVSGFEVRNSGGRGISMLGKHNVVSNNNVHHNEENGILARGDYGIVQDNLVWSNCMSNLNGVNENGPDSWAGALSAGQRYPLITVGVVLRHNTVYGNWGEGITTAGADSTLIEDNIIYDNWSNNLYIMNATNVLAQRNLVYVTGATPLATSFAAQAGIVMGDEVPLPKSQNNTVINNLVYGANQNFYWWKHSTPEYDSYGMTNDLIANNTFVNSTSTRAAIVIRDGVHVNTKFVNNIILQEGNLPISLTATNIQFANNLWSKAPSGALGQGDIVGDPLLIRSHPVTAGGLVGDWFKLLVGSPAIDAGSQVPVTNDFDSVSRPQGSGFDIGAYEFSGTSTTMTPTPTAPAGKPGDANGDGKVDGVDYVIWLTHYNQSVSGASNGDFNWSGNVDGADYVLWLDHYGI